MSVYTDYTLLNQNLESYATMSRQAVSKDLAKNNFSPSGGILKTEKVKIVAVLSIAVLMWSGIIAGILGGIEMHWDVARACRFFIGFGTVGAASLAVSTISLIAWHYLRKGNISKEEHEQLKKDINESMARHMEYCERQLRSGQAHQKRLEELKQLNPLKR